MKIDLPLLYLARGCTEAFPREYTDGTWSSFALRIGSNAQVVRVLISTAGSAPWVVSTLGCSPPGNPALCVDMRGGVFDSDTSQSWHPLGNFSLGLELNLRPSDIATFGLDTIALGFENATGGPQVDGQIVAAISGSQNMLGMFGLGDQDTNLNNFSAPRPSFLKTLYSKNLIPSLSWGYTAGAQYRKYLDLMGRQLRVSRTLLINHHYTDRF